MPFETATKILRARTAPPSARARVPHVFWRDRLQSGSGGTCFARVAAFDRLIEELGFATRRVLGRVREDYDHAALLVTAGGREWICDVGFPLTVLVPARAGRAEGATLDYEVGESARGFRIQFEAGVPDGPRGLEIFRDAVSHEEYRSRWDATFRPESKFLKQVVLHRFLENRTLMFARGELRVDDRHSRLTLPLPAPRPPALAEHFGVDSDLLARALAAAGDPDPREADATIEVYLESAAAADAAFAAIGSPEGYAHLLGGVADVAIRPKEPLAFDASLRLPSAPDAPSIEEEVRIQPDRRSITVARGGRRSEWRAEERDSRTWLIRRARLDGPRLDLLRNDSQRGRLAGTLAVDLVAWARLLSAESRVPSSESCS